MKISLFRAFPDPFRKSMQIYADRLVHGIRPLLEAHEEIVECLPQNLRLGPKLARHWDQYLRYQHFSKAVAGDVNHVIDHGYAHLVHSLPARRTVVTFHDAAVTKVAGVARSTRLSFRYSLSGIRKAAMVMADSEAARRDLLDLIDYPAERVKVVYLGVHDSFRVIPDRAALKRRHELPARYLLSVGHTLPHGNVKAHLLVLNGLVKQYGLDIQLLKVGDEFTVEQERLIDQLGLRKNVRHLGRVCFAELPAIYNCADVLLYPVQHAGFGLPPLEAMACGVPVVCSDRGSLPEVVGDAAITADPEDHQAMAKHIAALLSDRCLYDAYRAKGLERVRRYSWDRTAREVLAIYRELADA